jgi:hypothetical protein
MALMAAAIHDLGHPGVQQTFLTKVMDPLAVRYNDKSVLENFHLATAFELMLNELDSNWFELILHGGKSEFSWRDYVRKGLISMVLATDMSKHKRYVDKLADFIKSHPEGGTPSEVDPKQASEDKVFLLDTILHAADISNPSKPRASMLEWTKRVNNEFWAQGDKERDLDFEISPLCDRTTGRDSIPKGQIGFISFVVKPFFSHIVKIIPETQEALTGLVENKEFWDELSKKNATYEEIFDDARRFFNHW